MIYFFAIGFLVILVAVGYGFRTMSRRDKVTRQCPNCGGDETFGSRTEKVGTVYFYQCHLCEHTWTWDHTTPYPPVTVRPDLIAAGKARRAERPDHGTHGGPGNFG